MSDIYPSINSRLDDVRNRLSKPDIYEQLAEEAAELAQAANKMARVLRGTNPTPKTEEEALKSLIEEYSDVNLIAEDILEISPSTLTKNYKLYRWSRRLANMETAEDVDKPVVEGEQCMCDMCEIRFR